MNILKNAFFIGERVTWRAGCEPEGAGVVESIFSSMGDLLIYRIARDQVLPGRQYALVPEAEITGRVAEVEV